MRGGREEIQNSGGAHRQRHKVGGTPPSKSMSTRVPTKAGSWGAARALLMLCRRARRPRRKGSRERRREMRRKSEALKARNGTRALSSWGNETVCALRFPSWAWDAVRPRVRGPVAERRSYVLASLADRSKSLSLSDSRPQSCTGRIGGLGKSHLTQLSCSTHARTLRARKSASRATPQRHVP